LDCCQLLRKRSLAGLRRISRGAGEGIERDQWGKESEEGWISRIPLDYSLVNITRKCFKKGELAGGPMTRPSNLSRKKKGGGVKTIYIGED